MSKTCKGLVIPKLPEKEGIIGSISKLTTLFKDNSDEGTFIELRKKVLLHFKSIKLQDLEIFLNEVANH